MRSPLTALVLVALGCRNEPPRPRVRAERPDAAVAHAPDASAAPDVAVALAPAPAPAPIPTPAAEPGAARDPRLEDDPNADTPDEFANVRPVSSVPMPTVPAALEADVARLRVLVARTMRCWEHSDRVTHTPEPECPARYAELARGGPAAMHAIGQYAFHDLRHSLLRAERALTQTAATNHLGERSQGAGTIINTAPQLSEVFGGFEAKEVVPYVLMAMAPPIRRAYGDWGYAGAIHTWMDVLPRVTGNDLTPFPEWQRTEIDSDRLMRFLGDAHDTWSRWYRAHQDESLAQWRAQGLAHARAELVGRNVAQRVAAILRLGAETAAADDQEAARRSLAALLAERRLSNAGRRAMREFATRRRWSLDTDAGVGASDAR
jgi:hypothetical protein